MKTSDLTLRQEESLDDVAYLMYQAKPGGVAGVHTLARLLGWEEYGPCEPCEDDSAPMLDGCCMVCGENATTTTRED